MSQTISYKDILARHGFSFSKGLGQNFLTNPTIPARIAEGCGADGETFVLEVGPGAGILTRELGLRAAQVTALEIDERLLPVLAETLAGMDNCEILLSDVLKADIPAIVAQKSGGRRAVAAANLPYYITSPALSRLIDSGCFEAVTVMVQKEVAHRLAAKPGSADYGAFSVYVQYHGTPRILFDVPAGCFTPRPKVDSAVVRIDLGAPRVDTLSESRFFEVVKAGFAMRRKTLRNCLSAAFGSRLGSDGLSECFAAAGVEPSARAETLDLAAFGRLADAIELRLRKD
ncbi:MAG: ribosomal RNA small subunit methyltransferase A [Clostridia bacterium]|nr:ribosomal RNA small subunit methyltransferase A [Clostridia bacterium]